MNTTFTSKIRKAAAVLLVALGLVAGNMGAANAVSVPSPGCMSASATFYSVDNSGWDRSFRMSGSLYKSCGTYAALQYKMNFGPGTSTGWKTGISKYTNGSESAVFGDNFHTGNTAYGAWVRLCGYWSCNDYTAYVDNPYN